NPLVGQRVFQAAHGLFQVQRDGGVQVRARLRAGAPRARAAEERIEDVAKAAEALEPLEALRTGSAHAGGAEAVIAGALLRVAQDLVGGVDLLELGLCVLGLVAVGVVLHRQATEGLLDVILRGVPRDAQDGVEVCAFGRHRRSIVTAGLAVPKRDRSRWPTESPRNGEISTVPPLPRPAG